MKLEGIRDQYYFYTSKASDLTRQLAFAGLAVVWIFRVEQSSHATRLMASPTIFLIIALLFDFLQYFYGATFYHLVYESRERKKRRENLGNDHNFKIDLAMIRPMDCLFYLKAVAVTAAYVILFAQLFKNLFG